MSTTTYNFTIRATDSLGAYADRAFSVDVSNTAQENFVAVGNGTYVLSSKDGVTWTQRNITTQLKAVAYGNGKWIGIVTGATPGQIATSTDGISWSYSTVNTTLFPSLPALCYPSYVAYGNGVWVMGFIKNAVSVTTCVYTSTDGSTWVLRSTSLGGGTNPFVCAAGNNGNKWIIDIYTDTANFWVSTDNGATWSSVAKPAAFTSYQISYYAGVWVVTVASGNNVYTSYDNGVTWVIQTTAFVGTIYSPSVTYGNGNWVINTNVNSNALQFDYSKSALTYTHYSIASVGLNYTAVAFNVGKFVSLQRASTTLYYSSDGINWTGSAVPVAANVTYGADYTGVGCAIGVRS